MWLDGVVTIQHHLIIQNTYSFDQKSPVAKSLCFLKFSAIVLRGEVKFLRGCQLRGSSNAAKGDSMQVVTKGGGSSRIF